MVDCSPKQEINNISLDYPVTPDGKNATNNYYGNIKSTLVQMTKDKTISVSVKTVIAMGWNLLNVLKGKTLNLLQRKPGKQLIILKTEKSGKKSSIYPVFPLWTIPLDNQIVYEGKCLFIKVLQLKVKRKL